MGVIQSPVIDRIRSNLPDRQRRGFRNHVRLEPRKLFWRLLTADTSVEDVNHAVGKSLPERQLQARRERNYIVFA